MKPVNGLAVAFGLAPPPLVRRQVAWETYLIEAKALNYSEREAKAVVAGILELAKQCTWDIDVLGMAKLILARGDIEK